MDDIHPRVLDEGSVGADGIPLAIEAEHENPTIFPILPVCWTHVLDCNDGGITSRFMYSLVLKTLLFARRKLLVHISSSHPVLCQLEIGRLELVLEKRYGSRLVSHDVVGY